MAIVRTLTLAVLIRGDGDKVLELYNGWDWWVRVEHHPPKENIFLQPEAETEVVQIDDDHERLLYLVDHGIHDYSHGHHLHCSDSTASYPHPTWTNSTRSNYLTVKSCNWRPNSISVHTRRVLLSKNIDHPSFCIIKALDWGLEQC